MKEDKASQTAQYMALFRALETTQPTGKRLFTDPYAISFLDGKLNLAARLSPISFVRNYVQSTIKKKIPALCHQVLPAHAISMICYYKLYNTTFNR
ncbi:MAG TPA: hypothetical protein VM187_00175 [Niastella sp.]|nr:hypothetical protein [Niastella sp.]